MAFTRALSITSWFNSPLISMGPRHEILSRASCFVIKGARSRFLVASQHVVSPFRYPAYYSEETHGFVNVLEHDNIRLTVELRNEHGTILRRVPLTQPAIEHPSRDVVLVPIEENAFDSTNLLDNTTWPLEALRNFREGSDVEVRCVKIYLNSVGEVTIG